MAKKGGNIVIIGGGASGMTAAIRAKQLGAENVILLEAAAALGGNAVYAPVPLLDPEKLSEEAIEREYVEMMELSDWTSDPRIVRTLLENSARIPEWLEESGADLKEGEKDGKLAAFLVEQCYALGVDIRLNCYAKKILKDENDWACGVWVTQDGKSYAIDATVVIMATGGFLGENTLMEQYCPYYDEVFFDEVAHTGNLYTGNGVDMAIHAGAGDEGIVTFVFTDDKMPHYKGTLTPCIRTVVNDPCALVVNNVGIRFSNEAHPNSPASYYHQPNKDVFRIYSMDTIEALAEKYPKLVSVDRFMKDIEALIDADQALIAEDEKPIAAWIRGKYHILSGALDKYAKYTQTGHDDDFGKDPQHLLSFGQKGPYFVFRSGLALGFTMGPIKVNPMMSCVTKFDVPTAALCACGNLLGDIFTSHFISLERSRSIRFAIASGLLAGEHADMFTRGGGPAPKYTWPKFSAKEVMAGDYYNVGTPPGGIPSSFPKGAEFGAEPREGMPGSPNRSRLAH